MLWDEEGDSETMQMFKNMTFLKMPVTNKMRDEMTPSMGIISLLFIAGFALFLVFSR